jgi:2-amino-4-hydroxy-6-hydroxymethyldihydropteridine diphosphokinase
LNKSLIALGSNLGDRNQFIESAIQKISELGETAILKKSRIIETKALEFIDQDDFLNSIILVETSLDEFALLESLQQIEKLLGRILRFEKGPREIDLDILSFNSLNLYSTNLTLPHPAIYTRPFLKQLLLEIDEWNF